MRIAVIYNEPVRSTASDHWLAHDFGSLPADFEDASEFGVLGEVERVEQYLGNAGHETLRFAVHDVPSLVRFLEVEQPALIFNACESYCGNDELTAAVTGVFDLFGIEYTGSPTLTLGIGLDKSISKALFLAHGVRTPPFVLLEPGDPVPGHLKYPLIVKPVRTDASNGITAHSVVSNVKELVRRVRFVRDTFAQSALVEEFIDGRELNVALLAVSPTQWAVLPVAEIVFQNFGDRPRIVGYEAKWVPGTVEYNGTVPKCPADLPDELAAEIRELAVRAARVLGLRDYGRVDLRLRADNVPFVLEGNPNPDISHDAGFARSALASGRTHEQAILEMVARAIERLHARDRS